MTSYVLDEWFWSMFEPTPTWPNFVFGQLFVWIVANNDFLEAKLVISSNVRTHSKLT